MRYDHAKSSAGSHHTQENVVRALFHASNHSFYFNPMRVPFAVDQIFDIDSRWRGQIRCAQHLNGAMNHFWRKTTRAGLTAQFNPLARSQVRLAGLQIHIERVAFVLEETVAPCRVSEGEHTSYLHWNVFRRV